MSNYNGVIVTEQYKALARKKIKGGVIANCDPPPIALSRLKIKQGVNLENVNLVKFERIPKERILNKFKNLGGNIKY